MRKHLPLWNQHANRLNDSLTASAEGYTLVDVRDKIEEGRAQWHPFEECAVVTQILSRPHGRVCIIWLVAGTPEQLLVVEDQMVAWAREQGCVEMRFVGRRGWLKAFSHWADIGTIGRLKL